MADAVRLILGILIYAEIWLMFITNILVLTCIIKNRFYARKDDSIYILSGFNISCDICQITLHVVYVGPAIIIGSWIFDGQDSLGVTVAAMVFLGFWYLGSMIQILFAANRFVAVCFPRSALFTRKRVVFFIVICSCAALALVTYSQLLSPCCRITPDPFVYSYSYLPRPNETYNLSMYSADLPLDTTASVYCLISYAALFVYIRKAGARDDRSRSRELKCCIQFALIFVTYTIAWVTFFVYPAFGLREAAAYSVTLILHMIKCGVNSIIYLTMNAEIRRAVNELLHREIFDVPAIKNDRSVGSHTSRSKR
ncbi:hypothetical protein Aduo_000830 [Ancylostoma duodenale]